jgi:hypothetical protein
MNKYTHIDAHTLAHREVDRERDERLEVRM